MSKPIFDSNIFIENNLLANAALFADYCSRSRLAIVTDSSLAQQYLPILLQSLANYDYSILSLESGEENKNWSEIEKIIQHLLSHGHDRNTLLISFAGGVIGDLSGFAASIYMRGMKWLQIPTTLLAQVDAAIGGKTGCNFLGVKNLLGTFHQPNAIFIDPTLLRTLAEREYRSGLAEVVKYGMCCDAEFFLWLEQNVHSIRLRDPLTLQTMIERCCALKYALVLQDEQDHGLRKNLNFGHTFAHALEAATGFGRYLHGEAVAIGMLLATHLAVKLELVDFGLFIRLRNLLHALGINISYDTSVCGIRMLFDYMGKDKKRVNKALCLVLPCALGQVRALEYMDVKYLEGLMDGYTNC